MIEKKIADALKTMIDNVQYIIDNNITGIIAGDNSLKRGTINYGIMVSDLLETYPKSPLFRIKIELAALNKISTDKNGNKNMSLYNTLLNFLRTLDLVELASRSGITLHGVVEVKGDSIPGYEDNYQMRTCSCTMHVQN